MSDAEFTKNFPTIFGEARDNRSIVVAIDTSGSMYNKLDSVKTHLIEFLLDLAQHKNVYFNIVEFSSEIRCWADKMVACSQSTIEVAIPWIKSLTAKTGTNTLDALLTAFDNDCDCVYLVTDGLPDQHPFDIIDEVVFASNKRPVHCIYLTSDAQSDASAIRFLEKLSTETHGSFLMATMQRYGCLEKITPVYKADHQHERLVKSVQGNIHPADSKFCSITTSLCGDPIIPLLPAIAHCDSMLWPYVYEPYWWTRYHTAKTFMRSATKIGDSLVYSNMGVAPSASVLLIGQKVVARRQEDGYYYPGTVTSQLSTEMFLVEFQATTVGDYKETKYQETALYDLISFTDALRHPIIPGDRVLAPTAEGNYCPAIIIAGMEYRGSNKGDLDAPITVSLCDGRTRDLPPNSAIWIPPTVYDRIALELKVPQSARKPLKAVEGYPMKSLPGYPRSGSYAVPREFAKLYPSLIDCGDTLMDSTWFGWPRFVGVHSALYKPKSGHPVSYKASEIEAKAEETPVKAEEPVKEVKEQVEEQKEPEEVKEDQEKEEEKVEEVEEKKDDEQGMSDEEYLKLLEEICDDGDKYVIRRPKSAPSYVPWKTYWHTDPIPPLEPSRPGPFRDTTLKVPMELRELRTDEFGVENPGSQFLSTKSGRKPRHNESNLYRMQVLPHPQSTPVPHPPTRQPPTVEFTQTLGDAQRKIEEQEALRRDFRRRRVIIREDERVNKLLESEKMREVMRDRHRERILEQMERERTREHDQTEALLKSREAKRQMIREFRDMETQRAMNEMDKSSKRFDTRRAVQIQRVEAEAQRRLAEAARIQEERAAKDARCQDRWQQRHDALEEGEKQRLLRESHLRGVKLGRRERYRMLEAQGQKERELRATVFKDNQAVFRSAISY